MVGLPTTTTEKLEKNLPRNSPNTCSLENKKCLKTVVLLAIGMFFTAWFFVYEVTSTKYTRDVYKELLISLVASLFMGFGVLFLLLWVGIYV
ncbi:transmembrane protein 258-like [Mastacembelus armatus]|uniref:transmembrane protein 258-like n=1 Tax=Mastacembelus armatus TaxID=205130 RepID=UPI000E45C111|nr:transmembrane protein 258-like [Mastacembelus armatus]